MRQMSTPLRFLVPSARRVQTKAELPNLSELDVELVLKRCGAISRPIDVAMLLKRFGLGLSDAHKVLNRIVADETVHLRLGGAERSEMMRHFYELGVDAK